MQFFYLTAKEYWKSRGALMSKFLLLLTVSVASLVLICKFDIHEKVATMESELYLLGNYDICIYDSDNTELERVKQEDGIEQVGYYDTFGYVGIEEECYPVCYFDSEASIDMYHLTCLRGRYPQKENEIAADVETLRKLGVSPYPGESITVSVLDHDKNKLLEKKYVISGVFQLSNSELWGKYLRYPYYDSEDEYEMPTFVVGKNSMWENCSTHNLCIFFQVSWDDCGELYEKCSDVFEKDEDCFRRWQIQNGRRYAYCYLLGIGSSIYEDYGNITFTTIKQAIKDGNIHMDYLSGIVVFTVIIIACICVLLAVSFLINMILEERRQQIFVLRSIGAPVCVIIRNIWIEILSLCGLGCLLGIAFGEGLFRICFVFMQKICGIKIYDTSVADSIIHVVTRNPYFTAIVIVIGTICFVMSIQMYRFFRKTPIVMKNHGTRFFVKKEKLFPILIKELKCREYALVLIVSITMTFFICGFQFYLNLAEYLNNESGVKSIEADYRIKNRKEISDSVVGVEQWSEYGVPVSEIEKYLDDSRVKEISGYCLVSSTHLIYEETDERAEALAENDLRPEKQAENYASENQIEFVEGRLRQAGYDLNQAMIYAPSVLLDDRTISEMDWNLLDGTVDMESLKKGTEVVLYLKDPNLKRFFHVGDVLPVCNMDYISKEDSIFEKYNIPIKIGAVVTGNIEDFPYNIGQYGPFLQESNVIILSSVYAAKVFGYSENRYSSVDIYLNPKTDIKTMDNELNILIRKNKGCVIESEADMLQQQRNNIIRVFVIFGAMVIAVLFMGIISIAIILYVQNFTKRHSYKVLYSIGTDRNTLIWANVLKNLKKPLIGVGCALGINMLIAWLIKYILLPKMDDLVKTPNWFIAFFNMFLGKWWIVVLSVFVGMNVLLLAEIVVSMRKKHGNEVVRS